MTYGKGEIRYEADDKHRKIVLDYFGFNDKTRALSNNGDKEGKEEEWEKEELGREEAKEFRASAARLNFLGQDRTDIQQACKTICTYMSKPHKGYCGLLKRAARYLKGRQRCIQHFPFTGKPVTIEGFADSD